jgi:hypothetical protein
MQRGSIVDYTVSADASAALGGRVSEGDKYPMLIISYEDNDEATTANGVVFLPGGVFHPVHEVWEKPKPEPEPPKSALTEGDVNPTDSGTPAEAFGAPTPAAETPAPATDQQGVNQ